jgi:hypothetical protein
MTGGQGRDRYVFATTPFGDTIADFQAGTASTTVDSIDLSAIDARAGGADNAFVFIGSAAFTAGQFVRLRVSHDAGNTIVQGERTGDGIADFSLVLSGLIPLATITAADFVL